MMGTNRILHSNSTGYNILDCIGEGLFGTVHECLKLTTREMVAVKIFKYNVNIVTEREVNMLETLRALDTDKNNIVKFMESFEYDDYFCLVFEKLDISLNELMKMRCKPFDLNEIRPVAHQLLVALDAVHGLGIVHTDLNPDNIMLVDHINKPLKIKLIDFGLAHTGSELEFAMLLTSVAYRAPEIILGLPLSADIDVWGVGCILAFLYFGGEIFPNNDEYHAITVILQLLRQPPDSLLDLGHSTEKYFIRQKRKGWRLKTPKEYENTTGIHPNLSDKFIKFKTDLKTAVHKRLPKGHPMEMRDREAFLNLLKFCLEVDYEVRITPRKSKIFNFLTMAHLRNDTEISNYAVAASVLMTIATSPHSPEPESPHSHIECLSATRNISAGVDNREPDVSSQEKSSDTASFSYSSSFKEKSSVDKRDTDMSLLKISGSPFLKLFQTHGLGFFIFRNIWPKTTRSHTECFPTTSNMSAHAGDGDTGAARSELSCDTLCIFNSRNIWAKPIRFHTNCFPTTSYISAAVDNRDTDATRNILVTKPTNEAAPFISKHGVSGVSGPSDAEGVRSRCKVFGRMQRFCRRVRNRVVQTIETVRVAYRSNRFTSNLLFDFMLWTLHSYVP